MDRHDEEKKKVVITSEDVKNTEEFFSHFKMEMPPNVAKSLEKFKADPKAFTFEDQRALRGHLAHAVITIDHPLVKDDVFKNIRAKCEKAWFDYSFEQDLEKELSEKKT
jgi:hypothetical protein